jgi:putative ABC transport system permease protein
VDPAGAIAPEPLPPFRALGWTSRDLYRLAWRNIWRNRRRTLLTLSSIVLGLAALILQQSLIKSVQAKLVEKATSAFLGHVQIQAKGVVDTKVPDVRIGNPAGLVETALADPDVAAAGRRLVYTGLIASAQTSKGVMIASVDPAVEPELSQVARCIVEGRFLDPHREREALLGDWLARDLDVRPGGKIVLMVQAADGSLGAEAFRVAGIFHQNSEIYDKQIVYVRLKDGQRLMACGDEIGSVVVIAKRFDRIGAVRRRLAAALADRPVEVRSWREISREIVAIQAFQDVVLGIVLVIIFAIVAFGVANTLLMAIYERIREFGLMMAMGATRGEVSRLVVLESLLLGVLGVIAGAAIGFTVILWLGRTGIPLPLSDALSYLLPFDRVIHLRFAWPLHLISIAALLLTCVLAALAPAMKASRLTPVDALRHL